MSVLTESTTAWEPVTPRGVASFARASYERLLVVQCLIALVIALLAVWVLGHGFFPTVSDAIQQLPGTGQIINGELKIPDSSPRLLAEGRYLALVIDLKHGGQIRSPAQFQLEFGGDSLLIFSLFGVAQIDYPADGSFDFNQADLQPKWEAWAPEFLGLAGLTVFLSLLLSWNVLAIAYCLPVWLVSYLTNRDLNFRQSWRLAGAALMPGALLMAVSLWLYGIGAFDLIKLCFAFGMHLLVGLIYLIVSPFFLKRVDPASGNNPFTKAN